MKQERFDDWPRLMRRARAARYCDMSETKFDELVLDGRLPKATRLDGMVMWDRRALDAAIDDLIDAPLPHEEISL
jgi:predicted DNA-binding transcriptional regulator AlpA